MDPDLPRPSIETDGLPDAPPPPSIANTALEVNATAAATPLPPSSPFKSPYKARSPAQSSSPHKITRSPSSASSYSERQTTPMLQSKRSASNLSMGRATTPSRTQFRRTSSNLNPSSPVASFKSAMSSQEPPQRKILTSTMVAQDYFKKDLDLHKDSQSRVAVIVHDSCYGHRFSRPRTSKSALSSIVERPERIQATLLGASTAYVRLGSRHAHGRHPPHPDRQPPSHSVPFEIRKTSRFLPLNNLSVTHIHGSKWMEELQIMCDSAEGKLAMNGKELVRPIGYGKDENGNLLPKLHEGDLYLCAESLNALQGCLGGVCDAVDAVYGNSSTQRAFVCIRPPGHHCSSNVPSGFCWLNNVHVGITYGAINHGLTHAAIIDFDLHHGDGSQAIAWDHNRKAQALQKNAATHKKTPIGYYSVHDINSFPCEDADEQKIRNASVCIENSHGQSIWNVHFEHWKTHSEFWKLYQTRYMILLEKARKFLRHHTARLRQTGVPPKAAVFLSAGFDASEWEMAGMQRHGVNVPTDFYAQFTADVVKMSQEEDLGVDGRVISVLEGGYSDRALTSGVLSHLCGLTDEPSANVSIDHKGGLAASMMSPASNGLLDPDRTAPEMIDRYDPTWWSSDELEVIEAIVLGNMPQPPKSTKEKAAGSYSSPTQASTNRMAEVAKERRSLSAQLEARLSLENEAPPPPPDVGWAIAAYELSRLLIPTNRQILSCRHEELNAEATRARKERQSIVVVPAGESMQLRERRPKPPLIQPSTVRSSSRSSTRRTTIASINDLPDPTLSEGGSDGLANDRPRRRSSASSSIISGFQEMKLNEEAEGKASGQHKQATANSKPVAPAAPATTAKAAKPPVPRKSKAPTATKAPAKPRASPRKARHSSRPGSSSSERTNGSRVPSDPPIGVSRPPPQPRQVSGSTENGDGMDSITNEMKKVSIKLKMPSVDGHAAKQKKAEEQVKPAATTKAPRKPPAPRTVKPKPLAKTAPVSAPQPQTQFQPKPERSTPAAMSVEPSSNLPSANIASAPTPSSIERETEPANEPVLQDVPSQPQNQPDAAPLCLIGAHAATAASPPTHTSGLPTRTTAFDNPSRNKENTIPDANLAKLDEVDNLSIVPIKPEQPPFPAEVLTSRPQSNGIVWGRPLTPNKKTKDDLPKFTSSSPIPFSKNNSRPTSAAGGPQQEVKQDEKSIWDIPETPQQQR